MVTAVIALCVFGYAAFVIRRKIKDMKNGKYCSCNCEGCSGSCKKNRDK